MSKIVCFIVLGLLGYVLLQLLSIKEREYEKWQEFDRGDGDKFKNWR